MKKKFVVVMLLFSLIFVGCKNTNSDNNIEETLKDTYVVKYDGVDVTPGKEFDASKINSEASISEVPSCAFEGNDTIYAYDDIEITMVDKDNKKIIYSVYFISGELKTTEGISIGSTKDEMIKAYGEPINDDVEIKYTKDDVEIHFVITDEVITSIEYVLKSN